jgi:hypothetical protein
MVDELAERLEGRRARTTVEGVEVTGTVTGVTYTPKRGDLVLALTLDEPTPSGREEVPVGPDDIDPL